MKPHPHNRRLFCAPFWSLILGLLLIPSAWAGFYVTPVLPVINTNNIVNILNFGAIGDGVTTNSTAIQSAINAAAAGGVTNGASGGTVEIPAGIFMCGPITLKSHVNLQLDSGCFLRMLAFTNYPLALATNITSSFTTNTTTMVITTNFTTNVTFTAQNFISGSGLTDLEISGTGWIQGQGEPWWPFASVTGDTRPIMISLSGCNRTLIQFVTLSNSPEFHIAIGGKNGNTTVQFVTIRANASEDPLNPGHNTDACDVSGTNILVQNNNISVGDDNYTCSGGTSAMLITNNTYGNGHGVSIGSFTSPSVSNMTVVNCTFTNTDAGLRIKTDRDRGGNVHDILYGNLTMTNIQNPILIYTEYTNTTAMYRAVDSISPAIAASYPTSSISSTTPHYHDILISNLVANAKSTRAAGLLWGLPESSISNVTLINVHLAGSKTFGIYDAKNIQIIDSSHSVPVNVSQFSFYNTDVTFSNSTPSSSVVTLDGVTTNAQPNKFTFYNALMTLKNTNAIALNSSVTLGASTFIISNNLTLTASNTLNFILGSSAATIVVKGNLATGGTNNILAGPGFANGTYTLFTYTGTLSGPLPSLAAKPVGHAYAFDTSVLGQVNLIIGPPAPEIPANLTAVATNLLINLQWFAASDAASYNLKRSTNNGSTYSLLANLTATNYSDSAVNPGTTYTYVVSATNSTAESANSTPASAIPLPSLSPVPLQVQANGNQLQLSWPADHLGWRLQIQTNSLDTGLGTNWTDWLGSTNIEQTNINIDPANTGVFLRLVYP
jgi:polygalacturonase